MAGRRARWRAEFGFTYQSKITIIINQKKKLHKDMNWAREDFDGITREKSYLETGKSMDRCLTYGNQFIEKSFINRLLDCLVIYHQSVIRNPFECIPDLVLFEILPYEN
jgi:hypothetical protein